MDESALAEWRKTGQLPVAKEHHRFLLISVAGRTGNLSGFPQCRQGAFVHKFRAEGKLDR